MTNSTAAKKQAIEIDEFSFGAIRARLAMPIEASRIMTKNIGGRNIAFVNITDMKDILDERVPVWESHVTETKQIGDNLCVVVRLTIHSTDGIFSQDGTGLESLAINGYGDPFSNAYAQAFRRACESFALGRELWRKDHSSSSSSSSSNRQSSQPRRPQATKPAQGRADDARDAATNAQLVLLDRKLAENNLNAIDVLADEFPEIGDISQLSKAAASYLITQLAT
jgi:hypothetical protein